MLQKALALGKIISTCGSNIRSEFNFLKASWSLVMEKVLRFAGNASSNILPAFCFAFWTERVFDSGPFAGIDIVGFARGGTKSLALKSRS